MGARRLSSSASGCYEPRVRPRFVVVLCVAAWLIAALELVGVLVADPASRVPFGVLELRLGAAGGLLESVALCVGAWGLWTLRPWARVAAMAYLAAVILSFLFWGVGVGSDRAAWTLVWQLTVVPFATFCYMFLHNGRRYFGTEQSRTGAQ